MSIAEKWDRNMSIPEKRDKNMSTVEKRDNALTMIFLFFIFCKLGCVPCPTGPCNDLYARLRTLPCKPERRCVRAASYALRALYEMHAGYPAL